MNMTENHLEALEQEDESNLPLEIGFFFFFHIFYWQYYKLLVNGVPAAKCPDHSYNLVKHTEV